MSSSSKEALRTCLIVSSSASSSFTMGRRSGSGTGAHEHAKHERQLVVLVVELGFPVGRLLRERRVVEEVVRK